MIRVIGTLYLLAALGLAAYGLVGWLTLWLFLRHRRDLPPEPPTCSAALLPAVTVQLPVYNEPLVIEPLIDAAAALDYPRERLQIQVLDDSTDQTTGLAAARVNLHRLAGVDIELIHRKRRAGFKAGALQGGLERARGKYVAIFDADFRPDPAFLQQTIPHFLADPSLGTVQARWGHLNAEYNALTRAQAIALDKHFAVEQLVRHGANLFPRFNGTAGVWRKSCLLGCGGWQADTICEDLDLSTRAQLDGWRSLYLHRVVSRAELPPEMPAYKTQQARWTMGSLQCVAKYWRAILASRRHSLVARAYALLSMTGYLAHVLLLTLLLLLPPLLYWGYQLPPLLAWLGIAGAAQPLLFLVSQQVLYRDWVRRTLAGLPALVMVAIGLAPRNTWAVLETLLRRRKAFERTPKYNLVRQPGGGWSGKPEKRLDFARWDWLVLCEVGLTLYSVMGAWIALIRGSYGSLPFLLLCSAAMGYSAWSSGHTGRPKSGRSPRHAGRGKQDEWQTAALQRNP